MRIQAVLDSGNKTPGEIEKPGGTDESALQKIGNYERLASFHFKLKQHYDAKEYYKRAHLICQRLRPASSAIANGREQNPLSLRVMLRLADAYYALSANTCCCFQPGDTCNRRRLSTASISTNSSSTSDVVEKLTVEDDTLSDEFDRCSLTPEMNPVITQGNACYYHDYWKNKARHYREKVYNMKEIFQEGELDAQSTELYIQSLMNMEPGERDLAQIIRMYEEVAAWKEKFMGRDHKLTQRTRTRLKRSKLLKQDEMARRQGSAQAAGHIDPITTVRQLRTSTFPAAVSAPSTTEESPGTGTEVLLDSQVANGEAPEPQLQPKKHGTILKAFCDRVKRASIKAKVNTRHHKKA